MTTDWKQLPFREIWAVDTEFYPGPGLANGGVEGDPITPLCLVTLELRSGRLIRLWQDELGPFPPYRLDNEALIIGYMNAAEFGFHIAKGWGEPACSLDAYVEFRHATNDGSVRGGDREKGFYSLPGALRYFLEDEIDVTHKKDMRSRILQGPPFSFQEKRDILDYCEDDVRGLARLLPHTIQTLCSSLKHAVFRSKFQWATAQHQHRGIPMDGVLLPRLRRHWQGVRLGLVTELDQPFGCFEVVNGVAHWREQRFANYVRANRMSWPLRADGKLDQRTDTIEEMCGLYRQLVPLRELKASLSKLRLNDLAVGSDNRNRASLWAYGTKTARNAPQASQFVFGPAKWLRFLITPPVGRALVHRDFCQQEVRIAAVLSGDGALLAACESGDVYLGIAHQLGFLPDHLNEKERDDVRTLFKTVVLGIQYGLGYRSLAMRTGISLYEAKEILARLKARFHRFADWADSVCDHAGLDLGLSTPFGWHMQCPSGMNQRTLRNFPVQSTGSEILHVLCILAERRGIEIVAPVHDAVMAEGPADQAEDLALTLNQAMGDASAIVLQGYRLPTDQQIIRPGGRYFEKRGKKMWDTVTDLLARLEAEKIA
jgi:DNA polymerase I